MGGERPKVNEMTVHGQLELSGSGRALVRGCNSLAHHRSLLARLVKRLNSDTVCTTEARASTAAGMPSRSSCI